ncbi:MAG: hypothetical protein JHC98_07740 [Thermoleophilaceae bacterium]|jgi:hypothetical protein|nr:hypothetical protein [Thermoleophilaceae bacterium]
MAEDRKTIGLGLVGGAAAQLKLEQKDLDKLVKAIEAEEKWVEVNDEKRIVHLRADHVEFYSLESDDKEDRRAGF